jgi:predicted amidohydrolase YtcJ
MVSTRIAARLDRAVLVMGLVLALGVIHAPAPVFAQDADLIVHNAKVVTVDRGFSISQALAVKDGRLTKVGTDAEVLAQKGPGTKVVDLGGKTVLPGLIDSHTHPTGASMLEFDHAIGELETIQDVLDYIQAAGTG